jgi:hypothetical protein
MGFPGGGTDSDVVRDDSSSGSTTEDGLAVALNPRSIRLSQTSVRRAAEIINSMKANGWVGPPIDVVRMPDGGLTTVDNARVVAAGNAGIDVQTIIHPFDEPLPDITQVDWFTNPEGVPRDPRRWGTGEGHLSSTRRQIPRPPGIPEVSGSVRTAVVDTNESE